MASETGSSRRVIVTGGSAGIGAATAQRFVEAGDRVVILDRQDPDETQAAGFVRVDVREERSVRAGMSEALENLGGLDVLVCNAGIDHQGNIEETTLEDWDNVMSVNVRGVFLTMQTGIPALKQAGGGAIVVTASQLAFVVQRRSSLYCASKGALLQLVRGAAVDYAQYGIRVNCVCPGPTKTPMLEVQIGSADDPEEERQYLLQKQLNKQFIEAREIAAGIFFLASADASSVQGTSLVVDGGYVIH